MSRTPLSPGRLYAKLNEEWRHLRPAGCDRCRMPLPVAMARPDDVSANWRIGAAPWCPHRCDGVIVEIAGRLWPLYDLAED